MYDKYTARPFGRLFRAIHPNIAAESPPSLRYSANNCVKAKCFPPLGPRSSIPISQLGTGL